MSQVQDDGSTPIGQPYCPTGPLDVRAISTTTILGAVVAALGAGLIWLWEISPVPTLVIITPIIQGVIVGVALMFLVKKLHLRTPRLIAIVGFVCGLLSVGLVHYGHHLHMVDQIAATIREELDSPQARNEVPPQVRQQWLERLDNNKAEAVNEMALVAKTGHGGFLGTMLLRAEDGVMIKKMRVSGWGMGVLWAVEALFVAFAAAILPAAQSSSPYCESCGKWAEDRQNALVCNLADLDRLVSTLQTDDIRAAADLRDHSVPDLKVGTAAVTTHLCEGCSCGYVSVIRNTLNRKKENQAKTLVKAIRISPEMVETIIAPPTPMLDDLEKITPSA